MKYFNTTNTMGFDSDALAQMNIEFEELAANLNPDDPFYDSELKNIGDKIFNKYC